MEMLYFSGRINPQTGETERVLIHQITEGHALDIPRPIVRTTVTKTDYYDPTLAGFYEPKQDKADDRKA